MLHVTEWLWIIKTLFLKKKSCGQTEWFIIHEQQIYSILCGFLTTLGFNFGIYPESRFNITRNVRGKRISITWMSVSRPSLEQPATRSHSSFPPFPSLWSSSADHDSWWRDHGMFRIFNKKESLEFFSIEQSSFFTLEGEVWSLHIRFPSPTASS